MSSVSGIIRSSCAAGGGGDPSLRPRSSREALLGAHVVYRLSDEELDQVQDVVGLIKEELSKRPIGRLQKRAAEIAYHLSPRKPGGKVSCIADRFLLLRQKREMGAYLHSIESDLVFLLNHVPIEQIWEKIPEDFMDNPYLRMVVLETIRMKIKDRVPLAMEEEIDHLVDTHFDLGATVEEIIDSIYAITSHFYRQKYLRKHFIDLLLVSKGVDIFPIIRSKIVALSGKGDLDASEMARCLIGRAKMRKERGDSAGGSSRLRDLAKKDLRLGRSFAFLIHEGDLRERVLNTVAREMSVQGFFDDARKVLRHVSSERLRAELHDYIERKEADHDPFDDAASTLSVYGTGIDGVHLF